MSFELNKLKIELYNMLKSELLLSSKDNQINTLNQLNASLMQNREYSTESLLRELRSELSLMKQKEEKVEEEKVEVTNKEVSDEITPNEEVEETPEVDTTPVESKHFEIDGNPVLSYCADYVYKVEVSKDKPEKKAERVFEFLKFDAVKNSRIRPLDIYSVIGMPISSDLRKKLVESNVLTEEQIKKYNEPFNLGEDDLVEEE